MQFGSDQFLSFAHNLSQKVFVNNAKCDPSSICRALLLSLIFNTATILPNSEAADLSPQPSNNRTSEVGSNSGSPDEENEVWTGGILGQCCRIKTKVTLSVQKQGACTQKNTHIEQNTTCWNFCPLGEIVYNYDSITDAFICQGNCPRATTYPSQSSYFLNSGGSSLGIDSITGTTALTSQAHFKNSGNAIIVSSQGPLGGPFQTTAEMSMYGYSRPFQIYSGTDSTLPGYSCF